MAGYKPEMLYAITLPGKIISGIVNMLYSQGGVKVPTGGKSVTEITESPRALQITSEGQQIRCNSGADGYSPDGRE